MPRSSSNGLRSTSAFFCPCWRCFVSSCRLWPKTKTASHNQLQRSPLTRIAENACWIDLYCATNGFISHPLINAPVTLQRVLLVFERVIADRETVQLLSSERIVGQPEVIPIIEKGNLTKCLRNGIYGNLPARDQTPKQFTQNPTFRELRDYFRFARHLGAIDQVPEDDLSLQLSIGTTPHTRLCSA
jgi:hypothetical protein